MKRRYKRHLLIAVSIIVSMVALAYFGHRLRGHWREVGRAFAEANYLYLIPSVALIGVVYALRVVRWRVFLRPIQLVPYASVLSATCIGFMSSCLLALRAGEIIRPYVLHRKSGISFGHAIGTAVGLERVFDLIGICFLLVLIWGLLHAYPGQYAPSAGGAGAPAAAAQAPSAGGEQPAADQPDVGLTLQEVWAYGLKFAALGVVGLIGLVVLAFFPAVVLRVAAFSLQVLPGAWNQRLMGFLQSMVQSMEFIRSPAQVGAATLLSCATWLMFPLSTYTLARAFDLKLSFGGALVVQVIITAAVAAPQLPAFIGVFQVAAATAVGLFGVSRGDAGAFAMTLWAIHVLPITAVGLAFLWYEGLSLGGLARASRQAADRSEGGQPEA